MDIGQQLHDSAENLLALIRGTDDVREKKALRVQLNRVLEQTERLVGKNVDRATKKYVAATRELGEANAAIGEAIEDLGKVAETIRTVAKAIDLVVQIAAKAGGV